MAEERERRLERDEVSGVIERHVGAVGPTEDIAPGIVVFVPAAAPTPAGLGGATAELEAAGCAVEIADLGESDRRGRWLVTVTHPAWPRSAGSSA
jgi:hypothetical protein